MFNRCLKTLLVVSMTGLASVSPALAAAKKQAEATGQYYDDISGEMNLQALKKQRDVETQRIRKEIFTIRPALNNDREDMAMKVTERKVRIVREKNFLKAEFENGIDQLYQKGVERFARKEYSACRLDFQEVESLSPNYKQTKDYLKKLEKIRDINNKVKSADIALNISRPDQFKGAKK